MRILAIETSCDETSMSLVDFKKSPKETIFVYSHLTASQAQLHAQYGGVFPAIAKLEHVKACVPLMRSVFLESKNAFKKEDWINIKDIDTKSETIKEILNRDPNLANDLIEFIKNNDFPKIDAIAVTYGPGLEIALWVGITFAKSLGYLLNVPVIGINHMSGHLISGILTDDSLQKEIELKETPNNALSLLVSGGHTEIIQIENGQHKLMGETLDDAVGEAYDKVARLMDLTYPGGPKISKLAETARQQNVAPIDLPRPMLHSGDYNFSYSGLKTAVMYHLRKFPIQNENDKLALALGFENAAIEVLVKKTKKALSQTGANTLLLGGGVAANMHLQNELGKICKDLNVELLMPLKSLTGDNALMIALAANEKIKTTGLIDESSVLKATGVINIA